MAKVERPYCGRCDYDRHTCPGCGDNVEHGEIACVECNARVRRDEFEVVR